MAIVGHRFVLLSASSCPGTAADVCADMRSSPSRCCSCLVRVALCAGSAAVCRLEAGIHGGNPGMFGDIPHTLTWMHR
eukprot:2947175-Rhodomonas_salina.1